MARSENEAMELARAYLASRIFLRPCTDRFPAMYGVDVRDNYLFVVEYAGHNDRIGRSEYIAVSRATGEITAHGCHGE